MTVLFQCSHKLFSRAVCCNRFHPLKTLHGMPGEMSLAGFYSLWFACAVGIVQDRWCISSQGHLEWCWWMQHCSVTMGFLPFVMPEQPVKNYSTNWKKLLITLRMRSIWDAARITWTPLISIRHRVQRPTISDSVGTPICWTKVLLCAGGHRWRGVLVMWNGNWRLGCTHHQVLFALTHLQLPCSNSPKTEEWQASQQWRIMARLSCL